MLDQAFVSLVERLRTEVQEAGRFYLRQILDVEQLQQVFFLLIELTENKHKLFMDDDFAFR